MNRSRKDDELLTRYLLGQLSEQQQEAIEKKYFNDDDLYAELEAVEDELIDDYVSGRLSGADQRRVEQRLIRDAGKHEKVEFAREWKNLVARTSQSARQQASGRHSWTGADWINPARLNPFSNRALLLPLTATLILAALSVWLAVRVSQLGRDVEDLQAQRVTKERTEQNLQEEIENQRRRSDQLQEELAGARADLEDLKNPSSEPVASIVSFVLSLGAVRDQGPTSRFAVPAEATQVRLHAPFKAGDYPGYRAELQTVEGTVVWKGNRLKARNTRDGKTVAVTIPARVFGEQDYILMLLGISTEEEERVGEYFFRVVRK